jgi:hypothetical protein
LFLSYLTTRRPPGAIKYFERGTCPAFTKRLHCLSCVNNNPDHPDALRCAETLLALAHANVDKYAIYYRARCHPRVLPTVGRSVELDLKRGAPLHTEFSGDASTTPRNVYSVLGTRAGGSILHLCKKLGIKVASTQEGEQIPTLKCSEYAVYTRIVETALGVPPDGPTTILSDNLGNVRVSDNIGSSTNSRHFLIRYECLYQRIGDRQVTVHHVRDPDNPSDFLTKLGLSARKVDDSLAYASGWLSGETIMQSSSTPVANPASPPSAPPSPPPSPPPARPPPHTAPTNDGLMEDGVPMLARSISAPQGAHDWLCMPAVYGDLFLDQVTPAATASGNPHLTLHAVRPHTAPAVMEREDGLAQV